MVAEASSSRTAPSADSLAFSANIFTSQIDSWIPANFGTSYQPPSESLNNVADQDGNLGIGHPSLEVPKHKRQDHRAGQLEKMLGLNKKGKGRAEDGAVSTLKKEEEEEHEEEEESRGSIGKKRKIGTIDLLAGKKKAKAKMKAKSSEGGPSATNPATATKTQDDDSNGIASTITKTSADHTKTTTPSTSQDTPSSTPVPIPSTTSPNTTLTKGQRKNLRKKQKKAAASETQD